VGLPTRSPENVDYTAQELLETPEADRPAMLENITKALTMRLLQDEPSHQPNSHPSTPSTISTAMQIKRNHIKVLSS
jgi:hypothetical protein